MGFDWPGSTFLFVVICTPPLFRFVASCQITTSIHPSSISLEIDHFTICSCFSSPTIIA